MCTQGHAHARMRALAASMHAYQRQVGCLDRANACEARNERVGHTRRRGWSTVSSSRRPCR
eukprot:352712-Chlamydomonas_euryale.AAC.6